MDTVPSQDARNGIIHNPDGTTTNITVDPLVARYLPLWGLPNGPILAPGNTGIFTFVGSQITTENFVTARVDHRISEKDSLHGSYQYDKGNLTLPDPLDAVLQGSTTRRQFVSIEESHIFNPQLLNSFRVGYNRSVSVINQGVAAINPLAGEHSLATIPGKYAPGIAIQGGVTAFNGGLILTNAAFHLNAFQGYDDLFLTKGIHSLKVGFAVERDNNNVIQDLGPRGTFTFSSLTTFLTNQPNAFSAEIPGTIGHKGLGQSIFGVYIQDDIRLRPNLTVNLGVRYEMSTDPTERRGKIGSLRQLTAPAAILGGPLFLNPTLRNVEPRIGFAWDPFGNGKTSVRAGFGLFDALPLINEYALLSSFVPPFLIRRQVNPDRRPDRSHLGHLRRSAPAATCARLTFNSIPNAITSCSGT